MNEAMQKLIEAVQKASPVIWQAAYRQVWVDSIEMAVLALALGITARILFRYARLAKVTGPYDDGEVARFFLWAGTVVSSVACAICAAEAFECLANPTFAAIKNLKGLL